MIAGATAFAGAVLPFLAPREVLPRPKHVHIGYALAEVRAEVLQITGQQVTGASLDRGK
jgi:hypothetical protein